MNLQFIFIQTWLILLIAIKAKAGGTTRTEIPTTTRAGIARSFDYFNEKSSFGSGLSNQGI